MEFDLRKHTILLTVAGSRAYGIHTATSDVDMKGVGIAPKRYHMGCFTRWEQAEGPTHMDLFRDLLTPDELLAATSQKLEGTIFHLPKILGLAADANPNILDGLFCRDQEVRLSTPLGDRLRESRGLFISTKAKHTFSGYAASQLKRIRGHRSFLLNPPKAEPKRADFGLPDQTLIPADQLSMANAAVQKRLDEWAVDFGSLDPATEIQVKGLIQQYMVDVSTNLGFESGDSALWLAATRSIGLDSNLIYVMQQERGYKTAIEYWRQYQGWVKNRNPERAALEAKFGYDCYVDDTEFLTDTGWKLYDDISDSDLLATVYVGAQHTTRPWGSLEYQTPKERFDQRFTGNLYEFSGTHTNTMVTPNHRMLIRPVEKNTRVRHNWELEEAALLPNNFEVLRTITPRGKTYQNLQFEGLPISPENYMLLMGWFLSDGTFSFREGVVKDLRVSQKKGGKLCWSMSRFQTLQHEKCNSSLYEYERKSTTTSKNAIIEKILCVREKTIVQRMYADCGHSSDKRIPRWVFGLSKRLMSRLLDGLLGGDGTIRNTSLKSYVYYSSLPGLANDVQELAFMCGYETSLWGPYVNQTELGTCTMWHIHINKNTTQFKEMCRKNITTTYVENVRVVCFSVPNRTLVTRRKGNISIHGNCKHGAHLVRLLRMGREILTTGQVHVWRGAGGPGDAEELLSIRRGEWSYDRLVEWAEREDAALDQILKDKTYVVPRQPDRNAIEALCVDMIETFLKAA